MLKVLIIDDEKNVRENLKNLINWEDFGYIICGEAENGNDGLEKNRLLKPDLVITDIRMPGISGLEMIKLLKKGQKDIKILIVTGYSRFEYAREAIEQGVFGYLLKPLDEDDLEKKIIAIKMAIEKQRNDALFIEKNRRVALYQWLTSLIKGEIPDDFQESEFYSDFSSWKSFNLLFISPVKKKIPIRKYTSEIYQFFVQEGAGDFFILTPDEYVVCLVKDKQLPGNKLKNFYQMVKKITGEDIVIYIGNAVNHLKDLREVYEHIYGMRVNSFIDTQRNIVFLTNPRPVDNLPSPATPIDDLVVQLFIAIHLYKEEKIEEILNKLKRVVIIEKSGEDEIKSYYISLYYNIIRRVTRDRRDLNYLIGEYEEMVRIIGSRTHIEELNTIILQKCRKIAFELRAGKPRQENIREAVEYIDTHYNTNIKLKLLADMFHYNRAYLGQLFKEATGFPFNTYLDKVRIEKAKLLLHRGKKVYETAEQTGFNDVDNFHKKFKKYTGMSPSEYRKKPGE